MTVVNREPNRLAIEALQIGPADTVLELGFGPGVAIRAVAAAACQGLVLGIDSSPEMLAQASRRNRRAIEEKQVQLRLGRFDALPGPRNRPINSSLSTWSIFSARAGTRTAKPGAY